MNSQELKDVIERLLSRYSRTYVMLAAMQFMFVVSWFAPRQVYFMESVAMAVLVLDDVSDYYAREVFLDAKTFPLTIAKAMLSIAYMRTAWNDGCPT